MILLFWWMQFLKLFVNILRIVYLFSNLIHMYVCIPWKLSDIFFVAYPPCRHMRKVSWRRNCQFLERASLPLEIAQNIEKHIWSLTIEQFELFAFTNRLENFPIDDFLMFFLHSISKIHALPRVFSSRFFVVSGNTRAGRRRLSPVFCWLINFRTNGRVKRSAQWIEIYFRKNLFLSDPV